MIACVYTGNGCVEVKEVPEPRPGPGELLLKVAMATICGTDLRIVSRGHRKIRGGETRVLGHEVVGEIVEAAPGADGSWEGRRVTVAPNIGCGRCDMCVAGMNQLCPDCRPLGIAYEGGFAPLMVVPRQAVEDGNVVALPDSMSYTSAVLVEPLACCVNSAEALGIGPGDTVLVIGAGPMGVLHAVCSRLAGARLVMVADVVESRLDFARRMGTDLAFNVAAQDLKREVMAATGGQGASVVITACPSAQAQSQALELASVRGRINFFGGLPEGGSTVPLNTNLIHYRNLMVTGTSAQTLAQFRTAFNVMGSGRIDVTPLVSARFPLAEALEAFRAAQSGVEMKVAVIP